MADLDVGEVVDLTEGLSLLAILSSDDGATSIALGNIVSMMNVQARRQALFAYATQAFQPSHRPNFAPSCGLSKQADV